MPDSLAGANRIECAHDHLTCSGTVSIFGQAVLEEFRVSQNDPELVVQEVEEFCQVGVRDSGLRIQSGHGGGQAVLRRS